MLPKAAVAAAAVVLIGSAGVYAATQLLKTPEVTEHTITVGNTEYVDDDAIMATEASVPSLVMPSASSLLAVEYCSPGKKTNTGLLSDAGSRWRSVRVTSIQDDSALTP